MGLLRQLDQLSSLHIVVLCVTLGAAYVLAVCAYRLWFHPLAKFPGPVLGRLTNLYGAYYAWKGDGHLHMQQCHDKYGEYVRYAPGRLLVNSVSGMRRIYSHRSEFQKSSVYNVMVHRAPNTLTHIDKKGHGRKRRIISQGLSEAAIRSYEPLMLQSIQKLCDILGETTNTDGAARDETAWSAPHNMAKLANYLTFDIMSAVIFGESFDLLGNSANRFVPDCIEASNVRTSVLIQAQELSAWRLDRRLFRSAIDGRNKFISFVTRLLQTRLAAKEVLRADAFSFLLKAKDPETGDKLTLAELGAEATTLVVAGSDTSSTALAALFFYLSRSPAAYVRATAEVRAAFADAYQVRLGPLLSGCAYLAACIDEAMRLAPPAATALWRETTAPVELDGRAIPASVDVGTCTFALHRNAEVFDEPRKFMPERWLPENRTEAAQAAFAPFSVGPRSCVGKGLARAELMLAAAAVLQRFDFGPAPGLEAVGGGDSDGSGRGRGRGDPEEYQLWDHITCTKDGPMLQFRKRVS